MSAVAMMDVQGEDCDSRKAAIAGMGSGDGDVVEQAEAHGRAGPRVVARGPHESEAIASLSVDERVDHREAPTRGAMGSRRGPRGKVGIRVQVAPPCRRSGELFEVI